MPLHPGQVSWLPDELDRTRQADRSLLGRPKRHVGIVELQAIFRRVAVVYIDTFRFHPLFPFRRERGCQRKVWIRRIHTRRVSERDYFRHYHEICGPREIGLSQVLSGMIKRAQSQFHHDGMIETEGFLRFNFRAPCRM